MFPRLRSFLTTLARRKRFEASLDEEMRFHLDVHAEDLVRGGVPEPEAVRRARMQFGDIEAIKNECLRARGLRIGDEVASPGGAFSPDLLRYIRESPRRMPRSMSAKVRAVAGRAGRRAVSTDSGRAGRRAVSTDSANATAAEAGPEPADARARSRR